MNVGKMALSLFGDYYRSRRTVFSFLTNDLIKARMYIPVEKWLSTATLYALVLSFILVTLGLVFSVLLVDYVPIWGFLLKAEIDPLMLLAYLGLIAFAALACFLAMFLLFILYPRVKCWEKKRMIDGHLPYAIGWMSFMATAGVIPYLIFKKLSEAEEFFGEVSQEAKLVVKDVELLGFDFISALRNLTSTTPSTKLRTFIQGALTNSLSGGEMGTYFINKARETMEENRKGFAEFVEALGLISEVYIIGLVAAPLLIIVMFAAMMMLGRASPVILMAIIYGFIPLGSMMVVLLTDIMTPEGIK